MKRLFVFTIFFISEFLFAQPNYLVDSIVVKTSNDTVYVWDYNAWEQCAFQLDYTVETVDSIITITQIDTAADMTTCYGYHNFVVPVVGLSKGKYRIDIYRDCLYEEIRFIKSFRFEYIISNVNDCSERPNQFILHNAYPNPFNPTTKISYLILTSNFVTLKVYDILGREVQILVDEFQAGNTYSIDFDATNLTSGSYFYKLRVGNDYVETKKMLLIR